jgi:hypothetical protein
MIPFCLYCTVCGFRHFLRHASRASNASCSIHFQFRLAATSYQSHLPHLPSLPSLARLPRSLRIFLIRPPGTYENSIFNFVLPPQLRVPITFATFATFAFAPRQGLNNPCSLPSLARLPRSLRIFLIMIREQRFQFRLAAIIYQSHLPHYSPSLPLLRAFLARFASFSSRYENSIFNFVLPPPVVSNHNCLRFPLLRACLVLASHISHPGTRTV